MSPSVQPESRCLLDLAQHLNQASRAMTSTLVEALHRSRLHPTEFDALRILARAPAGRMRMGDLAAHLTASPSAASRIVDRLTAQGLIVRHHDSTDRRVQQAEITPAGQARLDDAEPAYAAAVSAALARVGLETADSRSLCAVLLAIARQ